MPEYAFRVRAAIADGHSEWSYSPPVPSTGGPEEWTNTPEPANSAAVGTPAIGGTPHLGQTLIANTSAITDANGLDKVQFHYQWLRVDETADVEITGATSPTYTLVNEDVDHAIKVQVSFNDRHGFAETLTSELTTQVKEVWTTTVTIGAVEDQDGSTLLGYTVFSGGIGSITSNEFVLGGQRHHISLILYGSDGLHLALVNDLERGLIVQIGDDQFNTTDASCQLRGAYTYNWADADLHWTVGQDVAILVSLSPESEVQPTCNKKPTGSPTITGVAQVGETLTAHTSGIADPNGLENATFTYQWTANDGNAETPIPDATAANYTVFSEDEGKTIRVQVSFTDDAGHQESLTSAPTAAAAASDAAPPPQQEDAESDEPPSPPTNLIAAANQDGSVTLNWEPPSDSQVTGYQILRRRPTLGENTLLVYVENTSSTATTYTDTDVTAGIRHVYRVKAINDAGLSGWSNYVRVTP